MKRMIRNISLITVIGLAVIGMAIGMFRSKISQSEGKIEVVMFYPNTEEEKNKNIAKSICEATVGALEGKDRIEAAVYELNMENYTSMEYKINASVMMKPDIVVLGGADTSDDPQLYQKLRDNGIRFLLVDGDDRASGRDAYIGIDNYEAGAMGARYVLEHVAADGRIAVISPFLTNVEKSEMVPASLIERYQGFRNTIAEEQWLITAECECSLDYLTALKKIRELLEGSPELTILFCTDSVSGAAAYTAVKETGMDGEMMILCFDLTTQISSGIAEGVITASIVQDIDAVGEKCAELLNSLSGEDEPLEEDTLYVEGQLVTEENLKDYWP